MPQIDTKLSPNLPQEDEPQSVIHAPPDYDPFEHVTMKQKSPTEGSENTVLQPPSPEAIIFSPVEKVGPSHVGERSRS